MLTDSDLRHLNSLVEDALAAGATPSRALEPLTQELKTRFCEGQDFAFATGCSTKGLDHHVMLASSATMMQPAATIYRELSGAGVHYNGMYGDGTMLRDDGAARSLTAVDRPAAPIAEQVTVCLRILDVSAVSLAPELASATRRHLSDILLTYPVLLHPAFLTPASPPDIEYTAIAWALARTPHGGLPRYSHFKRADEDGVDKALLQRLRSFARHPCVQMALTRAARRVRCNARGKTARDRAIHMGSELLARTLLNGGTRRVQFLASVMELEVLANPPGPATMPPLPMSNVVDKDVRLRELMETALASSLFAASGLVHTAPVLGTLPDSMRTHPHDLHFLADLRLRAPLLFGINPPESAAGFFILACTQRRVFLGRQDDLGPEEISRNVENLVHGLVAGGFQYSRAEAATFVLQATVGRSRPNNTFPRSDTTSATAFLKVIHSAGGFGANDVDVLAALKATHNDLVNWPDFNVPYRDAWVKAIEVLLVERTMMSVLNRPAAAAPEATTGAGVGGDGAEDVAPGRRRARASV